MDISGKRIDWTKEMNQIITASLVGVSLELCTPHIYIYTDDMYILMMG